MSRDSASPVGNHAPPAAAAPPAGAEAARRPARRWPRWMRRGPMEAAACLVITAGIVMMLQPFAMALYTWSFLTTLFGTVMFMVVSKFPR